MTHLDHGLLMRLKYVFDSRLLVCALACEDDGGREKNAHISSITGQIHEVCRKFIIR